MNPFLMQLLQQAGARAPQLGTISPKAAQNLTVLGAAAPLGAAAGAGAAYMTSPAAAPPAAPVPRFPSSNPFDMLQQQEKAQALNGQQRFSPAGPPVNLPGGPSPSLPVFASGALPQMPLPQPGAPRPPAGPAQPGPGQLQSSEANGGGVANIPTPNARPAGLPGGPTDFGFQSNGMPTVMRPQGPMPDGGTMAPQLNFGNPDSQIDFARASAAYMQNPGLMGLLGG